MSRDYLGTYAPRTRAARRFQAGGAMPPAGDPGMAPGMDPGMDPGMAPQGGGADIEGMLMQYAETRDPGLAVEICDSLIEMIAAESGGGAGMDPGMDPGMEAPMMRRGGRMTRLAPKFGKGGRLRG